MPTTLLPTYMAQQETGKTINTTPCINAKNSSSIFSSTTRIITGILLVLYSPCYITKSRAPKFVWLPCGTRHGSVVAFEFPLGFQIGLPL